jgi:hypothetical protein
MTRLPSRRGFADSVRGLPSLGFVAVAVTVGGATVSAAPIVSGFERFGRQAVDAPGRVEAGLLLVGELGCANCHAAGESAAANLLSKQGPALDRVGDRIRPEWLVRHLADPQGVKPGTTMPLALAGLGEKERSSRLTAIAHYLASTGTPDEGGFPGSDKADAKEGRAIHDRVGCAVCHGRLGAGDLLADQVPLGDLAAKWTPKGLEAFLADPLVLRPSSRMPRFALSEADRRHVVAALLGPLPAPAAVDHSLVAFRGRAWKTNATALPAADSLGEPTSAADVRGFDVAALAGRKNDFVAHLDGFLHAQRAGLYRFHLASDDGSRLFVAEKRVVDNDGIHPHTERHGEIELAVGVHPIRIEYFEGGGQQSLALDVTAPGHGRISALELVTPSADGTPAREPPPLKSDGFVVDPALVAEGRVAFEAAGCAACHLLADEARERLAERPKPLGSLVSPEATRIAVPAGCLAPVGDGGGSGERAAARVAYGLDAGQREAIHAALVWLRSESASTPPDDARAIDRALTALNCRACHARAAGPGLAAKGGVIPAVETFDEDGEPVLKEAARDALFTSSVQELGDEGRLPPTLTAAGDKLTPGFLREVLLEGGKDRGLTMKTLMPAWHASLATPLAERIARDPKTETPIPSLAGHAAGDIEDAGRFLSGAKGLGCIKCHSFGGEKGQSQGVVDMVRFPKRLRHEWFLAYVADPQRFRPGTRMPAAWPEGKAFHPDVLDGSPAGQIEGIWRYVSGSKPKPPIGASANPIELVPEGRPIVYRNFIEGAGSRAIGVGFPEKVSIAWDAEGMRLALVWRGAFLDAGRHWSGRGQGFQPPLGDGAYTPDAASAVAVLPSARDDWPKEPPRDRGARFRGYRLDAAGRPTFTWSLAGLTVSESFEPVAADAGRPVVRRTLRIEGTPQGGVAVFRAAAGGIVDEPGGWRRIDGNWRVRIGGEGPSFAPVVGDSGDLRSPINFGSDGTATIVEDLSW